MIRTRLILAALLAALATAFFASGAHRYLGLAELKEHQDAIAGYVEAHGVAAAAAYFALYVSVAALSLPGALVLTLAGGALFGTIVGTVLVSFASSAGATFAFLISRYLLRDWVHRRFGPAFRAIDEGVRREGAKYLFALRLIPAVPFFAINAAMGLTAMRARTFYWVSQLGMLPATVVYVNAGTQLAALETLSDIVSWRVAAALLALAALPFASRAAVALAARRRALAAWRHVRPARFDRNLIVIGGGAAGLVSAYVAASLKARVTLIEKDRMGGECLNTGCVPSKALLQTGRVVAMLRRAGEHGIRVGAPEVDFSAVMRRVREVIASIAPHDSVERYESLGVECLAGDARLVSPWEVEVLTAGGARRLTARSIIVASGSRPFIPAIDGLEAAGALTTDTVWNLGALPGRLAVLGGGAAGCELAQAFGRLGSRVTLIEAQPRLLPAEDHDVGEALAAQLRSEGVDVRLSCRVIRFVPGDAEARLELRGEGGSEVIDCDAVLCALGRTPNIEGLGLDALGIRIGPAGIETDEFLATACPGVYACGDVVGKMRLTNAASHEGWHAAANALFGPVKRFRVDYSALPRAVFTDPEVARVGLSEAEASAQGIPHVVTRFDLAELDRAIADGEARGFVKVLSVPGTDRILGATVVGAHASESIGEFASAIRGRRGLRSVLSTVHVYPSYSEANRFVAGAWRRTSAPAGLLRWVGRYHAWMRG